MRVRKARREDVPKAISLARKLGLNYPGMEADRLWIAEESGEVIGLVALRKHPDCLELCGLGLDGSFRGMGIGRALIEALMAETPGDVHLATVIPDFFASCGFERCASVPATFEARQKTTWCEGCRRELCTVMLRRKS